MEPKGHETGLETRQKDVSNTDFVLEKTIFSNIFEKDIQRVYFYKKAERLAKAIHLITPAFPTSSALRDRIDAIAVGLIDAAILPPSSARERLSRELLALSSMLSIARAGSLLSSMNADLIAKEARILLQEIAGYQEPRLFLEDAPTLSDVARLASGNAPKTHARPALAEPRKKGTEADKGHIKDISRTSDRRDAVLSVLRDKGEVYIKDISTVIRSVSEKTIQRELQAMVAEGVVKRRGERRWTLYSLA